MWYPPHCLIVSEAHNHGNDGDIVKCIEKASEYPPKQLKYFLEGNFVSETVANAIYLWEVEQSFE